MQIQAAQACFDIPWSDTGVPGYDVVVGADFRPVLLGLMGGAEGPLVRPAEVVRLAAHSPPAGPEITDQPQSQSIRPGESATLAVRTTDVGPLSYQWYLGQGGDDSSPIPDATNAHWTTPPMKSSGEYWARVSSQS